MSGNSVNELKYITQRKSAHDFRSQQYLRYGHRCQICDRHEDEFSRRLSVDHCHKTGKLRGLLCHQCNFALGSLQDDPNIAASAAAYLLSARL